MAYEDEHSFPQDLATGLQETVDWNDAGAFAHHNDHPNQRSYVIGGFELDPDFANNLLSITGGKAALYESVTETNDHRADDGPDAKELEGALFTVQRGPSGDLTINDDATNYAYIAIDHEQNDVAQFFVNTTGVPPSEPYLLLGRVDTDGEQTFEENRAPTGTYNRLRVTGETYGGEY